MTEHDEVSHPKHYCSHPSGVETIEVTENCGFLIGNAIKYVWRSDEKGSPLTDLKKALWYAERFASKRAASRILNIRNMNQGPLKKFYDAEESHFVRESIRALWNAQWSENELWIEVAIRNIKDLIRLNEST